MRFVDSDSLARIRTRQPVEVTVKVDCPVCGRSHVLPTSSAEVTRDEAREVCVKYHRGMRRLAAAVFEEPPFDPYWADPEP